MKPLTNDQRHLSLRHADGLRAKSPREESGRTFTAAQMTTAIESGDAKTLAAFKSVVEKDFESGSLVELGRSLDVLSACAETNRKAGLPLVIEVGEQGSQHAQSLIAQLALTKSELTAPFGINKAQVRTESIGQLHKLGILNMGDFKSFATPILENLEGTSPLAARSLRHFLQDGTSAFDRLDEIVQARIEARKAEKLNATTRFDAEIGGKKPASKFGPMLWRPE